MRARAKMRFRLQNSDSNPPAYRREGRGKRDGRARENEGSQNQKAQRKIEAQERGKTGKKATINRNSFVLYSTIRDDRQREREREREKVM